MAKVSFHDAKLPHSSFLPSEKRVVYRSLRRLLNEVERNAEKCHYEDADLLRLGVQISPLCLESDANDEASYFKSLPLDHAVVTARSESTWLDYGTKYDGERSGPGDYEFGRWICDCVRDDITEDNEETMASPMESTRWGWRG